MLKTAIPKMSPLTKVLVQRHIGGSVPAANGGVLSAHLPGLKIPKMERFAISKFKG